MAKVKICGITNLEDAIISIDAGAFALGFNFHPQSPRYINPLTARSIISQLPTYVLSVGVFVNEVEPGIVARLSDIAGVGAIQLHGDESPDYCLALRDRYVIKALRINSNFSPVSASEYKVQAILLDAFSTGAFGGTGLTTDWSLARKTRAVVPNLFLAGGLSPENVAEAIAVVGPYAVDACSCLESSPGRKDAARVRKFISNAIGAC